MALELKTKIRIDVAAEVIWVQDISGAYDASSNTGGWGDPNPELQESCVAVYAERVQDGANKVVELLTTQFIYDNTAPNNEVKEWQLTYDKDGQYNTTLFMFQVSTDGVNYVEGGAIQEGDYVFYNNGLKKMESSVLVDVTDLSALVGLTGVNIVQTTCEELMTAKARIIRNKAYKDYRQKREENVVDIDPYREKVTDMGLEIQGAHYEFVTNLKSQARETIDKFHKQYG